MNVAAPKFSWGFNFNTVLFSVMLVGWGISWGQMAKDVQSAAARDTAQDVRIEANAMAVNKISNFEYRLTQQERGASDLAQSVEELKQAVNNQSSDLRVIREIVSRLDAQQE